MGRTELDRSHSPACSVSSNRAPGKGKSLGESSKIVEITQRPAVQPLGAMVYEFGPFRLYPRDRTLVRG